MSDFVIVTDSAADLSKELVEKLDVRVVSLCFTIDGNLYHDDPDNREMEPKIFYDKLRSGGSATTNAVNVNDYIETIEPILTDGTNVPVIAFSSGLSSTYSSAVVAAEQLRDMYPDRKILVVDSLAASMGQALLVWLAVEEQRQGKLLEDVYGWAARCLSNLFFMWIGKVT